MSCGTVIAVDGPAASGKSTLARRLAARLGYAYLDTGLLYRAVGRRLLEAGARPDDAATARRAAETLEPADVDEALLGGELIGDAASTVAAFPAVRAALLPFQRRFAAQPPGAVLAGRDVGTVVCPDAPIKIFVTASVTERARRRFEELRARGEPVISARVLDDLIARDRRDEQRSIAPLRVAPDAYLLDTTELDADAAYEAALRYVETRSPAG
jgi:cytidylate kinase